MFIDADTCENIVSTLTANESSMNVRLGKIIETYRGLN